MACPLNRGSRQNTTSAGRLASRNSPQLAAWVRGAHRPLNRHCHSQLRLPMGRPFAPNPCACPIDVAPTRSSCSATQINAPTSPTPAPCPTVCVARRSAKGGGSAGPRDNLACDGAPLARHPTPTELRYGSDVPLTSRSKMCMFFHVASSRPRIKRNPIFPAAFPARRPPPSGAKCAKVGLGARRVQFANHV